MKITGYLLLVGAIILLGVGIPLNVDSGNVFWSAYDAIYGFGALYAANILINKVK